MTEAEFRDWARAQLRAMDDKIAAIAAAKAEPAKPRVLDQEWQGTIAGLTEKLASRVKAGEVAGLGFVFVDANDVTFTGWAVDSGFFALAGAATFMGLEILERFRKDEIEAANQNGEKAIA